MHRRAYLVILAAALRAGLKPHAAQMKALSAAAGADAVDLKARWAGEGVIVR